MRDVDGGVTIPAHSEVKFKPGGHHVMFIKLKAPFKEGMRIPATLTFQHAGDVHVTFKVKHPTYKAWMDGHTKPGHKGDGGNTSPDKDHLSH
jgi:copper(I)-binding protein